MSDFQRVKDAVNIVDLITRETGLHLEGKHLSRCPFCSGHGCFSIDEEKRLYKCFQCDKGGDIFTFLEDHSQIGKADALRKAATFAGITLPERKQAAPESHKLTVKESIFLEAASHYHGNILLNGGKSYLVEKRGHREETLKAMRVGWSTGGLVEALRAKGFSDSQIRESGLTKEITHNGSTFLADIIPKHVAVFPHFSFNKVLKFTLKDPKKFLKFQLEKKYWGDGWKFYNQDALRKFQEIIVVEGENDLLSVLDAGAQNVIGLNGPPADHQLKALKDYCKSKHLYLWMDNDSDEKNLRAKGKGYIRRICEALKGSANVRVITYPEEFNDPDEFVRGFKGDVKKEVKRLQSEAVDFVSWEIGEISSLTDLGKRLNALKERKIFAAVAEMVEAEKLVFMEKIERLGLTKTAIMEELNANQSLRSDLGVYLETLSNKKDADPNIIAMKMFRFFNESGRFFYDREDNVYLLYQHRTYSIGNNRPFNALVKKMSGLLPTKEPGRSVWESLASEAYNSGKRIDIASWISTNRVKNILYINLNAPGNMIFKLWGEGIEEIPNGINSDSVFLKSSQKILPVNFLPDCNISEGMEFLKTLFLDNLTCEKEQKYLVLCWAISAFLLDFVPYMALMNFSGATNSGKTTAARILSLIFYGDDHLGDPSTAAAYSLASQNPLLIIDNLETSDITKSIEKFFLLSATKGGKEKRTAGTESDTTQEKPSALVLKTAIEPFTKAEHINRTYDIEFFPKYKSDGFIEDDIKGSIVKNRDLIVSSILKFLQRDVLPELSTRNQYITILKKEYKNHAKNRTDEYLATLMLVLEKILKYIPYYGPDELLYGVESGASEVWKEWIEYQNTKAKDTETASNSIIKLLDGIVREYLIRMKDVTPDFHSDYGDTVFSFRHPEYFLELIKTKPQTIEEGDEKYTVATIEFVATSSDIVAAFDRFCKNNGYRNPYERGSVFSARLNNDRHLLKKCNWEVISKPGIEPYFRIVRGERSWKFRKTIIR